MAYVSGHRFFFHLSLCVVCVCVCVCVAWVAKCCGEQCLTFSWTKEVLILITAMHLLLSDFEGGFFFHVKTRSRVMYLGFFCVCVLILKSTVLMLWPTCCRCGRSAKSCRNSRGVVALNGSGEKSTSYRPAASTRYVPNQISLVSLSVSLCLSLSLSVSLSLSLSLSVCLSLSLSLSLYMKLLAYTWNCPSYSIHETLLAHRWNCPS